MAMNHLLVLRHKYQALQVAGKYKMILTRKKGTHLILTFTRSLMFCAIH